MTLSSIWTKIKGWLGQSTTGQGVAALLSAFYAYDTGHITAHQALIAAVGGAVLVLWPQKSSTLTPEISALLTDALPLLATVASVQRGGTGAASATSAAPAGEATPPATVAAPSLVQPVRPASSMAVAGLVLAGMVGIAALAGCSNTQVQEGAFAAEGAYIVAANAEKAALPSLSASVQATIQADDAKAYAAILVIRNEAQNGNLSVTDIATAENAVNVLVAALQAAGVKVSSTRAPVLLSAR